MNQNQSILPELNKLFVKSRKDWNFFVDTILNVRLDSDQKKILSAIQNERRVSVRSGTSRGKDFVSAVAALCFFYLHSPAKIILTGPTDRQVKKIMMPEIQKQFNNLLKFSREYGLPVSLWGECLTHEVKFTDAPDHFILAFKSDDKATENWSGFHSPNLMVVVTEASGIAQETFNAIEGILQGNSRLVIIFNPNQTHGEAYKSTRDPQYKKFKLSGLHSPNIINKKIIYPGQVDYEWVNEKVNKQGWTNKLSKEQYNPADPYHFVWEDEYYNASDLFAIKVLGEFPRSGSDVLIPYHWIEQANQRWFDIQESEIKENLRLGVDIAGMGNDNSCFTYRYGNYVKRIEILANADKKTTIHMELAGKINNLLKNPKDIAFIDTIGEGAGVYSRLSEMNIKNAISCKNSAHAHGLTDQTGERKFANLRAYIYWALRDALDPAFGFNLALPVDESLTQELSEMKWLLTSDGKIQIEKKEDIKKRIGRSPDSADALAYTFYPEAWITQEYKPVSKKSLGLF